ncbi:MAG: hypothetical protein ACLFTT_11995 [Candidatus Hydrogenedentota bacterium]
MQRLVCRLLVFVLPVLFTPGAWAWGPGTHVYIMELVAPQAPDLAFYGAMLPDCNATLFNTPEINRALKRLLHDEFGLLPPSALRTGLATHNSRWGADYFAHLIYHPEDPASDSAYATQKIRQLVAEFGITISQAEDVLELTVDYLVRMDHGPAFAARIARVASQVGTRPEEALVDAYTEPLRARVPRLTEAEAAYHIRRATQAFRSLATLYGEQMQQEDEAITAAIPALLAGHLDTDTPAARMYFERTVELCEDDYGAALRAIALRIGTKLDAMAGYTMP